MKKNILISMASATLLSLGLLSINSTNVNATVKVGQSSRLARNSYVYNNRGLRARKSSLKRGKIVYVLGKKTINGKAYVRIGKNQYIRLSNFSKAKSSANRPTGVLIHNAYIYNKNGIRISRQSLKKNKIVTLLGSKIINGKRYYQINKNQFVKAGNVSESLPNDDSQSTDFNNSSVNSSNSSNSNSTINANSGTNPVANNTNTNSSNNSSNSSFSNTNNSNPTTSSNNNSNTTPVNSTSNTSNPSQSTSNNTKPATSVPSSNKPSTPAAQPTAPSQPTQPKVEVHGGTNTIKHNSYVYDAKGNRELGKFVSKGDKVEVIGDSQAKNQTYYWVQFFNDAHNDVLWDGYLPLNAFDPNGKDQEFKPADEKDFEDLLTFLRNMNGKVYDHDRYDLATPAERANYQKAATTGSFVEDDTRSSKQDIADVEKMMTNAFNKLSGKKIKINDKKAGHKFTTKEGKEMVNLIKKKNGFKDATFDGFDGDYVKYTSEHHRLEYRIDALVTFTK